MLCFKKHSQARKCELSLALYHKNYGKWPRRNIQENVFTDVELNNDVKESLQICHELLEIQYADTKSMMSLCEYHNFGMIMCDLFEVDDEKLHIKGIQIQETPRQLDELKILLESMYKLKN